MAALSVHVGVIGWTGQHDRCRAIARELVDHVELLSVIYSDCDNSLEHGEGDWYQVSDAWFYGRKFEYFLSLASADIQLIIQADAVCDDWPTLIEGCKSAFTLYSCGVWVPYIEGTPFKPNMTSLWAVGHCHSVSVVDGIVWAFSRDVGERMRQLNYTDNNLGWGIELLASAYCYASALPVLRDASIDVQHLQGAGYRGDEAAQQMAAFLLQMNAKERAVHTLLQQYHRVMAFCRIKLKAFPWFGDVVSRCLGQWLKSRIAIIAE